jgi:hypothetical protein
MGSNPFFGGLTVHLCSKAFKAGKGVQDRQIVEFAENVPLQDNRLDYDTSAPFLLRYSSFRRGSGERGHPVAPYIGPDNPEKKPGYCCAAVPTSLDELRAFVAQNRAIPNINVGFECIAGEPDVLDIASCVAFDLDVKNTGKKAHATVLDKFRSLGWELPEASLFNKDVFLDHVLPHISSFLTDLFELRGTSLDPPLTLRDFYVGDACKPFVEEQRESILQGGILSFHVKIPRLMFQNQADRNAFKQACLTRLSRDLLATVDTTVYNKNRNMRLLCHQKFDGMPLMPYSRSGMYGDDEEYADPADVPASVMLNHAWSFVPPESQRLFTDETTAAFVSEERSQPKPPRGTGTRRGVVASDDAHVDDARIDPTVAVYENFCTAMKLPFDKNDYDFSLKESENDGVDYEVYLKQRAGKPRTCPVGAVHTSNQAKLVVRRGAVHYVCFSKPRGGGTVRTVCVGDTPGVEYDVLRSAYRKLCCEMFVGDLPYTLFEIPTDIVRAPRVDANGVKREQRIGRKTVEKMKDIVVSKCPTLDRANLKTHCFVLKSPYGAGKTHVLVAAINDLLRGNPYAKIAYIANTQALVAEMAKQINESVKPPPAPGQLPWRMMHYHDDDATGDDAAVAFCSQSAPKFAGRAWDLVVFDELNGQLWQVVGLTKPDTNESDVLKALVKLAHEARICAVADANADKDAVDFLLEAKRIPVICDTPECDAFAGKHVEVRAVVAYKTKAISKNATYLDVVEMTVANDGQVGIACATVNAVKQIATMLRRRGVPVLAIHGKDSSADKDYFTAMFGQTSNVSHDQGVQGPNWPYYKALIYSPTVTGGLSNNTCSLQLGIWSKYGPSVDQLSQQIKRCRKARHTIVWLLEDELLRARVPRLESTPSEPVVVTPELQVDSRGKSALVAAWNFQAVLRWLGATTRPYVRRGDDDDFASDASEGGEEEEEEAAADNGADMTMDTVYSKPYEVSGQKLTYRMQMTPPRPIPTREDVMAAECAPDVLAEELSHAHAHLAHDEVVRAVCARRFGGASLLDRLRISVELERQQRPANMLATLRAECKRMKMDYNITVVVADKTTLERASAEVRKCFVVFMAELAMAEVLWYFECMRERSHLEEGMVVVHVANDQVACDKPPGEGDVRAAIRRRAAAAMRDVLGDGAASFESLARPAPDEHDHGLDDAGDTYLSHRIATYLSAFDDAPEASDPPPYTYDSAVLLCKRFYSVMLSFGETNLDRVLLKVYDGLGRLLRVGAGTPDELGFGLKKKELLEAERLLQEYHMLFRRDVQSKFRCIVEFFNDLAGAGGNFRSIHGLYMNAFLGGSDGKRRKLEQRVLVSTADDALRKAGINKGLRAGPGDERRILLYRSGDGVTSRNASRHRLPDWPNEARGERDENVAKASDAIASLCSGPVGLRCSLKRKPNQPLERFQELVNACLDPLGMRWEGPKDEHGYRTVKLHDMLRSPWVGEHVAEIPLHWSRFWRAVETEKQKGAVPKEVRRQRLEQVLAPIRIPRAAGRRFLHHGALPQNGDGDGDVEGDGDDATTE